MNRWKGNRICLLLTICMIIAFSLTIVSCEKKPELNKYSSSSFEYFDTVTLITGYTTSREEFDSISNDIMGLLGEYHKLYTIYNRFEGLNNLCTINDIYDGVHREVEVDERILDLLEFCIDVNRKTNGSNNIAMGSVLSIWHNYREDGLDEPENAKLPTLDELNAASEHTNIDDIIINRERKTVFLRDPKMKLDVGSIAKGYAVECIAQELEKRGITGFCLNVGGNVRTIGVRGDGTQWRVGIENPKLGEEPQFLEILGIEDGSLVISGSYQRFYIVDGKQYHHIIDPDTLQPAQYYVSLAVACRSSAMGDALSTALFCMPYEEAFALIESMQDTEAYFVFKDGTKRQTSGFEKLIIK